MQATLIIAFVLVVIVIFAFLGRVTDTLIPVVALPLSLLITFIAMRGLGYSLDNLSLMALTLAIGFLVDDAIVFLENTVRRMERGEPPFEAAINSAKEISFTIMSMTISLAAVFIPLVFMTGLVGRIFREFAITIVIAILASGLVSLTLTPLMCARLLKERGDGSQKDVDGARHRRYRETSSGFVWRIALVVSASSLDLAGDLGRLSGGHDLAVHARAENVSAAGRQQRDLRRVHRAGRFVAKADARVSGSRRRDVAQRSERHH